MGLRYELCAESCNSPNGPTFTSMFRRTLNLFRAAGFLVPLTIYDGATSHIPVTSALQSQNIRNYPDPTHCYKKHWAAVLKAKSGRKFSTPWGTFEMSIFYKIFLHSSQDDFNYSYRMSQNLLNPNSFEKMSVDLCNRFFDPRVAIGLLHMKVAEGQPDPEAQSAAHYLLFINE